MGQQQSRQGLLLQCCVVNDGSEFTLRSDPEQRVTAVKAAIKSHAPDIIDCEDFALDLYAPRLADGSRLEVTSEHLMQLRRGKVPFEIYKAMAAANFLVSRYRLSKYKFLGSGDDEVIQILVRKPGELVIQPTWTLMPPEPPNLADRRLYCVRFNEAVKKLQNVHYRWFNASLGRPHGSVDVIPLLDNPSGSGKTVLATNYIQWCRELWPEAARGRFQKELCACHTIHPPVPDAEFRGRKITAQVANEALAEAVRRQLEPGTEMPMLSETSVNLTAFASRLVKALGPLFVVLDHIHVWFMSDEGGTESLELFIQFCSDVLCTWMNVPQFYVVLTGCGSFLQLVQSDEAYCYRGLYFEISRVGLPLLRPTEISEILCKTKVRRGCELTLRERWGLTSDKDLEIAARLLFERSSGYPQALSGLLEDHITFANLTEADDYEVGECVELHRALRTYHPLLRQWLLDGSVVDVTCEVEDDECLKEETIAHILELCHLSWEGTLSKAKVFALPSSKRDVVDIVYPLREHIEHIADSMSYMGSNCADTLKWLCLKSLQEKSAPRSKSRSALSDFIKSGSVLGKYTGVHYRASFLVLPQIVPDSDSDYFETSSTNVIEAERASVDDWPRLMRGITILLSVSAGKQTSLCFKFRPQSASTDALLVARFNEDKHFSSKRPQRINAYFSGICTLTVGLTVVTTKLSKTNVLEECAKFDKMFTDLDEFTKASFGSMVNVLVLVVTQTHEDISSMFGEVGRMTSPAGYAHITEVLLLDLSGPEDREKFFGLYSETGNLRVQELFRAVEMVVKKSQTEG